MINYLKLITMYHSRIFINEKSCAKCYFLFTLRPCSSIKQKIELKENIFPTTGEVEYWKHPGRLSVKKVRLPERVEKAMEKILVDYNIKDLIEKATELTKRLKIRFRPVEKSFLYKKTQQIQERLKINLDKVNLNQLNEEERLNITALTKNELVRAVKKKIHFWKPLEFNTFTGLQFMTSRMPAMYGALCKIFHEVKIRHPDFKPKNILDFGSGVGSTMWAAHNTWGNSLREFVNVDNSEEMNNLATLLNQEGKEMNPPFLKELFFRHFLAATHRVKYDIVVSAYSLFDLPSEEDRLKLIADLWNKTSKYLVIVEYGSREGHKVVMEARDLILEAGKRQLQETFEDPADIGEESKYLEDESADGSASAENIKLDRMGKFKTKLLLDPGQVFSPCPHDLACPRLQKKYRNFPCTFEVTYKPVSFLFPKINNMTERFSYVVMHKTSAERPVECWPRIIEPIMLRRKHVICQLCSSNGSDSRVIFTAYKHGKPLYRCARSSSWGDLLPVHQEWTKEE